MSIEEANSPEPVELQPGIGDGEGDAKIVRQVDLVEPDSDLKLPVNQLHNQFWAQRVQLQYLLGTSTQGQGRTASPQGKGKGHTSNANFSCTDENRGAHTKNLNSSSPAYPPSFDGRGEPQEAYDSAVQFVRPKEAAKIELTAHPAVGEQFNA